MVPILFIAAAVAIFAGLIITAPMGYQDDKGFWYGEPGDDDA